MFSFFEKISTGSNTDSDLRVVRFDGVNAKERETIDGVGDNMNSDDDEDSLPKFKMPVPSRHQLTQA